MTDETIFWYQLDPHQRAEVASRFRGLPLSTLNLSLRVYNALMRHNARMDVAELMTADQSITDVYQLGKGALAEISEHMLALLDGSVSLRVYEPPAAAETAKAAQAPEVQYLPEPLRAEPLGLLRLSGRSVRALREQGITTIGQLERLQDRELVKIEGVGQKSLVTVREQIAVLYRFVQPEGTADWYGFWQALGISILPEPAMPMTSVPDVVRALPEVIEQIFLAEGKERQWHMVQRRFGLGGVPKRTLDELGQAFDLTRERVRQLTSKAVDILSAVLLEQDYAERTYQVDPALLRELARVLDRIRTLAAPGMLERSFRQVLLQEFGLTEQQFDSVDDLLFAFAGLHRMQPGSSALEPFVYLQAAPLPFDAELMVQAIHDVLSKRAGSLPDVDLLIEVKKVLNKSGRISLEDIRSAARLCSTLELLKDTTYRCRFECLDSRSEQVERILLENGKAMPVTEIFRTMNHRLTLAESRTINERSIANHISNDDRFEPIGRSGEWALKIWNLETANIVAVMRQYLILRNSAATLEEIAAYVRERRDASEASVRMYLLWDDAFAEVTRDTWGLAEWREAREAVTWNRQQVAQFVEEFFKSRRSKQVDFAELKSALIQRSGLPPREVQGLLGHSPAITTKLVGSRRRIAVFQPDYRQRLQEGGLKIVRKQKTLSQQVAEETRALLSGAPNHEMPLSELIAKISAKYKDDQKRPYSTFHSYVSKLDFIEKYGGTGGAPVMVRMKAAASSQSPTNEDAR